MTSRLARPLLAALVALLVLSGCSGGSDTPTGSGSPGASASSAASRAAAAKTRACDAAVDRLVSSTQAYVDSYGPAVSGKQSSGGDAGSGAGGPDLRKGLDAAKSRIERLQCDPGPLRSALDSGLGRVTARGALAGAVRAQLVAALTGAASTTPETVRLAPDDDLAALLPTLAPGSTVVLPAGTVRLSRTLVLLQGVTLRGQGRGRTTLASTARDTGVLVLTDGKVELDAVTVRHTGAKSASVVVAGPTSSLVLTDAAVSGARSGGDPASGRGGGSGGGGTGVLMSARTGQAGDRGTTLEVTGTRIRDNDAAGVLLSGGHRASIRHTTFTRNGQCGVCFLDTSSGALRDSTLSGNGAGVAVVDRARPLLRDLSIRGGQVGVQAGNTAAPVVRHVTVRGTARAAMIFTDRARGRVDGATCLGTPAGIVVAAKAVPYLGRNRCGFQPGR